MSKSFRLALITLAFAGCQTGQEPDNTPTMHYAPDPHSSAKPEQAVVKHLKLDLSADFTAKQLSGSATWQVDHTGDDTLYLDTYGLNINRVEVDGKETDQWSLGEHSETFGQPLAIFMKEGAQEVTVHYSTGQGAKALQWLDPEQTAGKAHPFLFTQSQAILARTWIPCQDSPGIRFTYEARISVPKELLALMSATNPTGLNESGVYNFSMPQPIPSYLMALAVGNIEFRSVDERTGVYAEPELLDTARWEFNDMGEMVTVAEELYGPYAWERYDLLVLPPSFPFGGMENPRLTFATPTILAGDRSLVALVAHELAHSWSGNLVTNATWNDFWLNEGFTVYFEQRIMEAMYGRDYSEMLTSLSLDGLKSEVEEFMTSKPEDTRLKLDLAGRNPDDGVTSIAYDKGYFFLRLLEETVGRKQFDTFLKDYFQRNKFRVMDTERFVALLNDSLLTEDQRATVGVEKWIYEPGLPENCPVPVATRFGAVDSLRSLFVEKRQLPATEITAGWSTHEWLHFIKGLPPSMDQSMMTALDRACGFTNSGNSEILAAWFQPVIRNQYTGAYPKVEEFLVKVGRRKFLTPTYRAFMETGQEAEARRIYALARPNYHAVSRETLDDLMKE